MEPPVRCGLSGALAVNDDTPDDLAFQTADCIGVAVRVRGATGSSASATSPLCLRLVLRSLAFCLRIQMTLSAKLLPGIRSRTALPKNIVGRCPWWYADLRHPSDTPWQVATSKSGNFRSIFVAINPCVNAKAPDIYIAPVAVPKAAVVWPTDSNLLYN
jgi:hypothetical protein